MKYPILLSFILLLSASCKKDVQKDGELCTTRSNDDSGALRLGGLYYLQLENSNILYTLILNQNGTMGRIDFESDLSDAEEYLNSDDVREFIDDRKSYWGVYHIEDSNIFIDTWHITSNGINKGYRWSGEILSDSSFRITSSSLCDGSEYRTLNRLYYFHPLNNKPDSVTSLIP